jgi:deoxyadenosine/deoxycytidine kinase
MLDLNEIAKDLGLHINNAADDLIYLDISTDNTKNRVKKANQNIDKADERSQAYFRRACKIFWMALGVVLCVVVLAVLLNN